MPDCSHELNEGTWSANAQRLVFYRYCWKCDSFVTETITYPDKQTTIEVESRLDRLARWEQEEADRARATAAPD